VTKTRNWQIPRTSIRVIRASACRRATGCTEARIATLHGVVAHIFFSTPPTPTGSGSLVSLRIGTGKRVGPVRPMSGSTPDALRRQRWASEPSPNIGVTPYCPRFLEPSCARAFLAASQA